MSRRLLVAVVFAQLCAAAAWADITRASLEIQGAGLRVETVSVTTGVDIPTTIQTSFAGRTNDEAPAVDGLLAVGELTGPGIDVPIQLTATPGYRFHIPALPRLGDYYLQNIRLMSGNDVVQPAAPSLAKITVADLLQTSLSVRQLTPEEIRARGIVVDARNYDVYEYSFTFLVNGEEVVVPFPVIIDPRTHVITPVVEEKDYGLPNPVKNVVPPRWTPPEIIPFEFPDLTAEPIQDPGQQPRERTANPTRPRIPAALVIPNSLAVLHQFFAVMLTVTNGAPDGSTARLEDVAAQLKIKVPTALRAVKSTPSVAFGQAVPVVDPNTGVTVLIAQSKGEAEWVLEGLKPGTHTVEVDITATLREENQRDVYLRATPSASVIIHDPRFNVTFSHPATIRKGLDYSTFAFITNMSPQTQTIRVSDGLPECTAEQSPSVCRVSGGPPPADMTIPSGEMRVVEYRLRSGITGQVYATAGTIDSENVTAAVQLHMGVSATGIPLSPATLVLPHYAQFIEPALVADYLQLLGLGYSLATAPVNQTTAKFPRVIKTDVFYRANDIARAGQRVFISNEASDAKRDALSNLLLDLLGNSIELREWDELRRLERAGRTAGAAVTEQLRATLIGGQADIGAAVDTFAAATAHRDGYLFAVAHAPNGATRPLSVALRGISGRTAAIANEIDGDWQRELPFADLSHFDAFGRAGELAVAGRWTEDLELVVTPHVAGPFEIDVVYPGTSDGTTMRARLVVAGTANEPVRVPITRGAATLTATLTNGAFVSSGIGNAVPLAPIAISGARQDLHLDKEGHKVSLLFSRPVAVPEGVDLLTKFAGRIAFDKDGVVFNDVRAIFAAALQGDQRVVNLSFDHVLSTNANYTIDVAPLVDPATAASVSFPTVVPKIDNDRPAGILYGRFLTGLNEPIADAEIKFFTGHWYGCAREEVRVGDEFGVACNPFEEAPQYARTLADGSFLFEYVPRDVIADPGLTGAYKAVGVTPEGRATVVEGAVRLPGRVHHVNLQLLGRGSAEGRVRYDNGEVASGVRVHVSSTMFNVGRDATTDANGLFRVDDLAVGPITFSASDAAGNVAFASGEIATPGQIVAKEIVIFRKPFPGTGTVHGRVTRSDDGAPVFGARVGIQSQGYGFAESATDSDGRFEFTNVPAGFVTLLAAEWSVSRENAAADFDLKPDETKEMNLSLSVTPSDMKFVRVTGRVVRENPLFPGDPSKYERVPGAVVNLAILTTTADANGEFAFDGVPIIAGDAANPKTIRAYDPSTKRLGTLQVPTLSETQPNDVTVFLPASSYGGGTIRVRIVSAHGVPVDGFRVIEPGFPPYALTRVGAGVYEYRDAPVNTEIHIVAVDGPEAFGEQVGQGRIRLDFAGQSATLVIRLPGQGTVRAKLRGDLDLIGDVALTYAVWEEGEQRLEARTVLQSTSENGVAGYATFAAIPALQSYTVSSAHPVYGYAEARGQLAYDGDVTLHTLQLDKLATVRGTVYAIDGSTPIAGAAVRLFDGRREAGTVYSQPDGTFVFHDVPAATDFHVIAEVTQSGIYRIGVAFGRTPDLGGPAPDVSLLLRRRGSVEGRVVYAEYKVYDPDNPANHVADDTPDDFSDNAPVPLARLWLRELDFPERSFGTAADPLIADVGGRFAVGNVFVGSLRAMAWSAENQELRGNWTGILREEGEIVTPVYIAVGAGGTGTLQVKVVDPNQQYLPIGNAEVRLYRGGLFDLTTTDDAGLARFTELPVGSYGADAYSKALGNSGAAPGFTIVKDQTTDVRIELDFVGKVDGRLVDPMESPVKPLPGVPVKLTASSFYAIASTDVAGLFFFEGIREGNFELEAKDTASNRWAWGKGVVTPENRRPFVELELERTDSLHVAVYLPDDTGANSGRLAGAFDVEVVQRCFPECTYRRALQGNPLVFPNLFVTDRWNAPQGYSIALREIGGAARTMSFEGALPSGNAANPLQLVYPAFGAIEVLVTQGGAPAQGARVHLAQGRDTRTLSTDSGGKATASGLLLGNVSVQAVSLDGRFSGAAGATIARQSVPATVTIDLGAYAGVGGNVIAESGGPSIGTRVAASFAGRTLEMLTDGDGAYLFQGIPTSPAGTLVTLSYVGPDGVTIGAQREARLNNDWASRVLVLGDVTLDATPPQLVSVTPADGSQNVSPDAPVRFVFSEAIDERDLIASNLQLVAADGSGAVPATITWAMQGQEMLVTVAPQLQAGERFPLRSNTLYRIIVHANLRDKTGHRLPAPRGFTFTTSDYAEPRVVKLVPSDKLPLPAQVTLQFHFNEPVAATGITFRFYKVTQAGAVIAEKAGTSYVDPASGLFLAFAPDEELEPDAFYRAVFSGVTDLQGNAVPQQTFNYFSFDNVAPVIRLLSPVPDGVTLVSGVEYTLHVEAPPDLASVEFLRVDGDTESWLTTATAAPFSYRFSGPEAPAAGIPFTIRAKPKDLSGNEGEPATIGWTVKPNAAPKNVVLTLTPASAYPGATVTAGVTFEDEGVLAPLQVVARGTNQNETEYVRSESEEARRANVGEPWPPVAIPFALPVTLKPGSTAAFTATVTDVRGLSATATANLTILADTIKPAIVSTSPAPETTYTLNAKYVVQATVSDAETGVAEVQFVVDGTTHRVTTSAPGANGTRVFTSPQITAGARNVDTRIPIVIRVADHHGNVATRDFDVIYIGVNDPTAPRGTWLCPVDRAVVPASQTAYTIPLKLRALDDVSVTGVKFRVTGIAEPLVATRIGTSDDFEALLTIDTPAAGSDFAITAIVDDANELHTIEVPINLDVVAVDRILESTEAVDFDTVHLYTGKSLLVKAPGKLVINEPLTLANLLVVDGGRLETLGTTLTRERKLDLTVTGRLYVDCTSTVDVTARGYLGGWGMNPDGTGTRSDSPNGRTLGNTSTGGASDAGASHGGHGGTNAAGATNATYGSVTDPFDLGSGGGGLPSAQHEFGGTGGGAVSLRTSDDADATARIVVAGTIHANGGGGTDELRGRNGGSGGSIRVNARQVVIGPLARLSANGGSGPSGCGAGLSQCTGGSGGRIAVTATERLDLASPASQLFAHGGAMGAGGDRLSAAPGTVYVRRPGQTLGELYVSSPPLLTRATPLADLALDRLILGSHALVRIDGAFSATTIEQDPTAVLVNRNDAPSLAGTTTPTSGASVIRNTPVEALVDLTANGGGVLTFESDLSAAPPKRLTTFPAYPLSVDDHRLTWTVPHDAPLGPATLTLKLTDRADRVFETTLATFTVVDNLAPVIDSFAASPQSLYPGSSVTATLAASDDVRVTRVTTAATIGATAPTTITRTPGAKLANEVFTFAIPIDTPGGTPMTIETSVEDGFPGRTATKQLVNVTILTDTIAPQAAIAAPADAQLFQEAAATFAISVTASDAEVRVQSVSARVADGAPLQLTPDGAFTTWSGTLNIPPVEGDEIATSPVTVTATDYAGNATTKSIDIRVQPTIDPNAPIVRWTCARNVTVAASTPVTLRIEAKPANASNPVQKVEFLAGSDPAILAASIGNDLWEATWNVPAGAATHTITAVATSSGGASMSQKSIVTAVVADHVFAADATITAADLSFDNKTIAVTGGRLTISGAHTFTALYVHGGNVTHPAADASFHLTAGTIYVGCGGAIDASARGYASNGTYPGAATPFAYTGGSHIGRGRGFGAGSTFGSIYRPAEPGGSAYASGAGGGVLRIQATDLTIDGAIRANGEDVHRSGAGGSVWITTGRVAGNGSIEARGGSAGHVAGGGGAIALDYTDAASSVPRLVMHGGTSTSAGLFGGSGTAVVRGPSSVFGELIVDAGTSDVTELPSLGSGIAQRGSGGTTLVADRALPPYVAGHFVEIAGKGTFRIESVNAATMTLPGGANAAPGDAWQGVYRFDNIRAEGTAVIESADPFRLTGDASLTGSTAGEIVCRTEVAADDLTVHGTLSATRLVTVNRLTIASDAIVRHEQGARLDLAAGTLEVLGTIDATARGYAPNATYPGATAPFPYVGGSHIGRGRGFGSHSTFGSVYHPNEAGGAADNAGDDGGAGGGIVHIDATGVVVNGAIRANGQDFHRSGAGGSIAIAAARISGAGTIEARGGAAGHVAGGGGAIAAEYTDATSTLPQLLARGGTSASALPGGAGSVLLRGPGSTFGDLILDQNGAANDVTELPPLGGGIAQSGTSGATLVTDRAADVPPYFIGHSVELMGKGIYRVIAVSAKTITLEAGAGAQPGDSWQGVYRVDTLRLRGVRVESADPILYTTLDKDAGSTLISNAAAPQFPDALRAQIAVSGDTLSAPAGAVVDADQPVTLTATNTRTLQTFTAVAAANGSFTMTIGGAFGDTFTLRATDSHVYPLTSATIAVNGAMSETASLASLTLDRATALAGESAVGTIRLTAPARAGGVTATLASSSAAATVPATVTVPANAMAAQFPITTTAAGEAVISATLANVESVTLTIAPTNAIAALTLSSSTIEGGTSLDGTVLLGTEAPANGAVVLLSSDTPLVTVPASITVPAGATQTTFTVATSRVGSTTRGTINASWGASRSASVDLTACAAIPRIAAPSPIALTTNWIDDAPPANATVSGDAAFDTNQAASGTSALHFNAGTWSVSGAAPLSVAAGDSLVLYALVNPCNPPRQLSVIWTDGTSSWRASWGESRVAPLDAKIVGALPNGGVWTRLEVPANVIGMPAASLTGISIAVDGGELWLDAIGNASCALPKQPAPALLANEQVWFDDALPAGALTPEAAFDWVSSQTASGSVASLIPAAAGVHKRWFHNATAGMTLNMDDAIVVYVFLDPCNPPRELMLELNDGPNWNRRVYWGENLIPYGTAGDTWTVERRRMGALPETGKWVRLEVPVASMQMSGTTLTGLSVVLHDGQAWFDRVGKVSRVNLALGKVATQSSGTADPPARAVDGDVLTYQHTENNAEAWWQVDLGAVQPIDSIDVWNGGLNLCCQERLSNFWVLVSDEPFASTSLAAARAQAGVTSYYQMSNAGRPSGFEIARKGRYVRVQLAGTNWLHAAEVQVWAPLSASPVNLAGGRSASQSSTAAGGAGPHLAEMAVNGSSMGVSFSHTNLDAGAWWQVDLGSVQWISTVDVDNTSGCCGARMSDFYVFVSDVPFASNAFADLVAQPGVSAYYRGGWATAYAYPVARTGRYVRIQLTGTNYLHPFEVKVWSPLLTLPPLARAPRID